MARRSQYTWGEKIKIFKEREYTLQLVWDM